MSADRSSEDLLRASPVGSDDNLRDAELSPSRIAKKKKIILPRNSVLFMALTELMVASSLLTIALYLFLDVTRIIDGFLDSSELPEFKKLMLNDEKYEILNSAVLRSRFLGFAPLFTCGLVLSAAALLKLIESFIHGASLWFLMASNAFIVVITAIIIFGSSFVYVDIGKYPEDNVGSIDSYGNMLIYIAQSLNSYNSTKFPIKMGEVHGKMSCCGFHLPTDYLNSPQRVAMKNRPQELSDFSHFDFDPGRYADWDLGVPDEDGFVAIAPMSCCPFEQKMKNNTRCNQIQVKSSGDGSFEVIERASIYDIGCITRFAVTFELQALLVLITSLSLVVISVGDVLFHWWKHMRLAKKVDLLSKYD